MSFLNKKTNNSLDLEFKLKRKMQLKFDKRMIAKLNTVVSDLRNTNRVIYVYDNTCTVIMDQGFAKNNSLNFKASDFYIAIKQKEYEELLNVKEKYFRLVTENRIRNEMKQIHPVNNNTQQSNSSVPPEAAEADKEKTLKHEDLKEDKTVRVDSFLEKENPDVDKHAKEAEKVNNPSTGTSIENMKKNYEVEKGEPSPEDVNKALEDEENKESEEPINKRKVNGSKTWDKKYK